MTPAPRCPRCETRDTVPARPGLLLEASDQEIEATHECRRCHKAFRRIEPETAKESEWSRRAVPA